MPNKQEQTISTNESENFIDKVAFVTGAASGIGRATALAFARAGASVVVADISEQGNQKTARLIEEAGSRALAVRCDVTQAEVVRARLHGSPAHGVRPGRDQHSHCDHLSCRN